MCYFDGHTKNLGPVPEALLSAIDARLADATDVWQREDAGKPNKFACFAATTQHIVFQYPISLTSHTESQFLPCWDLWSAVIQPVIDHVVGFYHYDTGRTTRIMLAKLIAGGKMGVHTDAAPAAETPHKIHVPLITAPGVEFVAEGRGYHLQRGTAYEVNNRVLHGGHNHSSIDRVHLIFDYYDAAEPTNAHSSARSQALLKI